MTQMLTDTFNREQQTTRKVHVSGVLFSFLRLPTFLLPPQKIMPNCKLGSKECQCLWHGTLKAFYVPSEISLVIESNKLQVFTMSKKK